MLFYVYVLQLIVGTGLLCYFMCIDWHILTGKKQQILS